MKKILYLTFYFEPDLSAGSFRNSPLIKELAQQAKGKASVDVVTTSPNRYSSFEAEASQFEQKDNYTVTRIAVPRHQSGMKDQIFSFKKYYRGVKKTIKGKKYDLIVASSSRLFTAYLGYTVAKKMNIPLYLDIRDIFYDTMEDVLKNRLLKKMTLPIIKLIERKTFMYAKHINLISGGFRPYFRPYTQAEYSTYPNGIDNLFIQANNTPVIQEKLSPEIRTIVYAGNLGEGQGLHKIIPQVAKALEGRYRFIVIGDGGAKQKIINEIETSSVRNVEVHPPVKREELIDVYKRADFLFVHLNDYKAFKKVLPSKLFELATFPKPIIAGVGGYAANFVRNNIENTILFDPCGVQELIDKLTIYQYQQVKRTRFIEAFKREVVNRDMAQTILNYI